MGAYEASQGCTVRSSLRKKATKNRPQEKPRNSKQTNKQQQQQPKLEVVTFACYPSAGQVTTGRPMVLNLPNAVDEWFSTLLML